MGCAGNHPLIWHDYLVTAFLIHIKMQVWVSLEKGEPPKQKGNQCFTMLASPRTFATAQTPTLSGTPNMFWANSPPLPVPRWCSGRQPPGISFQSRGVPTRGAEGQREAVHRGSQGRHLAPLAISLLSTDQTNTQLSPRDGENRVESQPLIVLWLLVPPVSPNYQIDFHFFWSVALLDLRAVKLAEIYRWIPTI